MPSLRGNYPFTYELIDMSLMVVYHIPLLPYSIISSLSLLSFKNVSKELK